VREYHFHIITKFISGLRSDIRHAMITNSYGVDSVEDTFDFALKIDFQGDSAKVWEQCSKCEGYRHYDYQCPSESDMLILCLVMMLTIEGC